MLPRVLTIAEIAALNERVPVETEVFAFGGLCVMAEGRCSLSAYVTGQSPNIRGVCSPASQVRYEERGDMLVSRLGGFTINRFGPDEPAGYPTLCNTTERMKSFNRSVASATARRALWRESQGRGCARPAPEGH